MRAGTGAAALALSWVLASGGALAGCGYGFSTRWVGKGGVEEVDVRLLENRSTEPGLGAAVTDVLRAAVARRGAGPGGAARIEGEVRVRPPVASSPEARTWHVGLELRLRLVRGEEVLAEGAFTREADFLSGADPVESEGRRALALRRLAEELAPEVLAAFER